MEPWIDIKTNPPTRCGNICVKLSDVKTALTHAVVAIVGKYQVPDGFLLRLRTSGEFTLLADNIVVACYVFYTHDASEPESVFVKAEDIVSYYYY